MTKDDIIRAHWSVGRRRWPTGDDWRLLHLLDMARNALRMLRPAFLVVSVELIVRRRSRQWIRRSARALCLVLLMPRYSGALICSSPPYDVGCSCSGTVGTIDTACTSRMCGVGSKCVDCSNGIKDGNETDVDCGGPDCSGCASGKPCRIGDDCRDFMCGLDAKCVEGSRCDGDFNGDQVVTINEIIVAVNNALHDCAPPPMQPALIAGQTISARIKQASETDAYTFTLEGPMQVDVGVSSTVLYPVCLEIKPPVGQLPIVGGERACGSKCLGSGGIPTCANCNPSFVSKRLVLQAGTYFVLVSGQSLDCPVGDYSLSYQALP